MAAPDKVYRYFTNLKAKTYDSSNNTYDTFFVRVAKPLASYVTSGLSYAQQLEELKSKFKIDGILWIKNPDTPCEPYTSGDDPNTVVVEDPTSPSGTATIVDPDLNDPDRSGFIAYVYPSGNNAAFHDIETTPKNQANPAAYQYKDYADRSWSRASRFRYKAYQDSEEAIILNDAGLNRRGDTEIANGYPTNYVIWSSYDVSGLPNFNDFRLRAKFYTTPFNRLFNTRLKTRFTVNNVETTALLGDGGFIPKAGAQGDSTGTYISFIGRRSPVVTLEDNKLVNVDFSNYNPIFLSTTYPTYNLDILNSNTKIEFVLGNYTFFTEVQNEEGTVLSSEVSSPIDLYSWNCDDAQHENRYGEADINSDTDRISISHKSGEVALARYNAKLPATVNQFDASAIQDDTNGDPAPDTSLDAQIIFTPTRNFSRFINESSDEASASDGTFFINEAVRTVTIDDVSRNACSFNYLVPGKLIADADANQTRTDCSSYLVMQCKVNNAAESAYCLKYKYYASTGWVSLVRSWRLDYNGTEWYLSGIYPPGSSPQFTAFIVENENDDEEDAVTLLDPQNSNGYFFKLKFSSMPTGSIPYTASVSLSQAGQYVGIIDSGGNPVTMPIIINSSSSTASFVLIPFKVLRDPNQIGATMVDKAIFTANFTQTVNTGFESSQTFNITKMITTMGYDSHYHVSDIVTLTRCRYNDYTTPEDSWSDVKNTGADTNNKRDVFIGESPNDDKMYIDDNGDLLLFGSPYNPGYYISNYIGTDGTITNDNFENMYYVDATGTFIRLRPN